jgi:hypothetical protein
MDTHRTFAKALWKSCILWWSNASSIKPKTVNFLYPEYNTFHKWVHAKWTLCEFEVHILFHFDKNGFWLWVASFNYTCRWWEKSWLLYLCFCHLQVFILILSLKVHSIFTLILASRFKDFNAMKVSVGRL